MVQKDQIIILENIVKSELEVFRQKLRNNYSDALDKIDDKLRDVFKHYGVDGKLTYAEISKYNRLKNLRKEIREELNKLGNKSIRKIDSLSKTVYNESFYRNSFAIAQDAGVSTTFGTFNKTAIEKSLSNPLDKIAKLKGKAHLKEKVNRTLTESLTMGDSYFNLVSKLSDDFDKHRYTWERIARTETNRVENEAVNHSYEKAKNKGIELQREWVATLDQRTRPSHASLNKQKEDKNSQWTYPSGIKTDMPGHGPAGEVINCRCRTIAVIEGAEPKLRRIRGEGITQDTTFEDWAAKKGIKRSRYGSDYDFSLKRLDLTMNKAPDPIRSVYNKMPPPEIKTIYLGKSYCQGNKIRIRNYTDKATREYASAHEWGHYFFNSLEDGERRSLLRAIKRDQRNYWFLNPNNLNTVRQIRKAEKKVLKISNKYDKRVKGIFEDMVQAASKGKLNFKRHSKEYFKKTRKRLTESVAHVTSIETLKYKNGNNMLSKYFQNFYKKTMDLYGRKS